MRLTLFGFNILALTMLVGPAFLIFSAMQPRGDLSWSAFIAVFGLGSAACVGAMAQLSRKRGGDTTRGMTLLSFGVALLTVGFGWLFLATLGR